MAACALSPLTRVSSARTTLPQHYLPTLLAFHNRSAECDCSLGATTQNSPTFTGWWEW